MIESNTVSNESSNESKPVSDSATNNQPTKKGKGKVRITKDQVASVRKVLAGLRPVTKTKEVQPGFSGQEFVKEVYADIVAATNKGYTLQQIAELLKAQAKVEIPHPTLKNYISRAKAEKKKQGKGEPANTPADTAPAPAAQPDSNTQPPAEVK